MSNHGGYRVFIDNDEVKIYQTFGGVFNHKIPRHFPEKCDVLLRTGGLTTEEMKSSLILTAWANLEDVEHRFNAVVDFVSNYIDAKEQVNDKVIEFLDNLDFQPDNESGAQ